MDAPRIGIVGAGPAGLTLARILRLRGIGAVVFERESSSAARPQGGSLDMHAESGLFAIEQARLTGEFRKIARYEDQQVRIYDKHGNLRFLDTDTSAANRPEVDRGQLRQMLLDSLPADTVQWNCELKSAARVPGGGAVIEFANRQSAQYDLLVGADGAWSRIRPLLTAAVPIYSGILFHEFHIPNADLDHPDLAELVGHGMLFALGDGGKAILAHRDAGAHLTVYAGLRCAADRQLTAAQIAAQFPGWSPALLRLMQASSQPPVLRPIYALPPGIRWPHYPGITLLGDAAHLMPPFTGDGANFAMLDAADLAARLSSGGDGRAVVQEFEAAMLERVERSAVESRDSMNAVFSETGLEYIVRFMESARSNQSATPLP